MMSIWGEADADEISDDPFRIEENWYLARAVELYEKVVDAAEGHSQLIIKWKINEPDSQFNGLPVRQNPSYYKKRNDELDGEQIQRNGFLKLLLRQGFDLTPEEIKTFNPKMGLGKLAMIKVVNNPDKNNSDVIYNNVAAVLSERLYKERYGEDGEPPSDSNDDLLDEI